MLVMSTHDVSVHSKILLIIQSHVEALFVCYSSSVALTKHTQLYHDNRVGADIFHSSLFAVSSACGPAHFHSLGNPGFCLTHAVRRSNAGARVLYYSSSLRMRIPGPAGPCTQRAGCPAGRSRAAVAGERPRVTTDVWTRPVGEDCADATCSRVSPTLQLYPD